MSPSQTSSETETTAFASAPALLPLMLPLNPLSQPVDDDEMSSHCSSSSSRRRRRRRVRSRRFFMMQLFATVSTMTFIMGAHGFSPDMASRTKHHNTKATATGATTSLFHKQGSPLLPTVGTTPSSSATSTSTTATMRRQRTRRTTKKPLSLASGSVSSTTTTTSSRSTSTSSSGTTSVLHQIQPLTAMSAERRRKALQAMDRSKVDSSLQGVDATMLELLSEQFLYPLAGTSSSTTLYQKNINHQNNNNQNNNNINNNQNNHVVQKEVRTRPRGRPEFVPGAMNYDTMIKFRQRRNGLLEAAAVAAAAAANVNSNGVNTIPNINDIHHHNDNDNHNNNMPVMAPSSTYRGATSLEERTERTLDDFNNHMDNGDAKQTRLIKGASSLDFALDYEKPQLKVADAAVTEEPVKKRKRVVKNLPEPRSRPPPSTDDDEDTTSLLLSSSSDGDESDIVMMAAPAKLKDGALKTRASTTSSTHSPSHNVNLNLQKYYRTELLSAQEEYSLGIKTQFLMKCEQVHEGLAAYLLRLPTLEEWAMACGFKDPDPTFVPTEADEQLRPAGSDSMFDEIDPHMFIGNGPASAAGPGRGRGRVKRPPPLKLGNFYDDTPLRFSQAAAIANNNKKLDPINQGSVTEFVEMLMDCKAAKQRMVQCNMRLVISIARKYANVGVNLQDLVQEGSLGLTRAAEKFEPTKGFKFSTYASWWIQQAVFRSIAYHSRTIRLPVHVHNLLNRVRKVRMALERDLGRKPSNEEMAAQLEMSVQKYNKMIRLTKRSISLELPKYQSNPKDLGHESDDLLVDTIDANTVVLDDSCPERRVDRSLFHDDLKEMLKILEEDERRVICFRYGLADGLTRTVTAVAAQMKQSKAWVRSQECRALRKLRRPWYEKKLKEHQDALTS